MTRRLLLGALGGLLVAAAPAAAAESVTVETISTTGAGGGTLASFFGLPTAYTGGVFVGAR